nr:hypothetical protein [Tanacetum cinerariifolium]
MALIFVDTYNMIAYLTKSDASEGFDQILDFLNASSIQYALTVNPNIYVSCIKQFWSSSVKKTNDVVRLQALIDRKKVIITEDTVPQALRLDDAESIDCLPKEEIFIELVRMRYEKPSTKHTFYKAFFLRSMEVPYTYYTSILVRNVDSSSKFYMYLRFLQLIIPADDVDDVVVDDVPAANVKPTLPSPTPATIPPPSEELPSTSQVAPTPPPSPIAPPSLPPQQPQPSQLTTIFMELLNTLLETCTTLTRRVENLEQDKIAQALEITKLKQRVRILEKRNKVKALGLKRLKKVETTQRIESSVGMLVEKYADVQGRLEESQAKVYHIDLEHADKVLSMQDDKPEPVELEEVIEVVTSAKLITKVVTTATTPIIAAIITAAPSAARRRKRVKEKGKQDNAVLRYQALKRKPQTEAQARNNMMVYLKNMAGFKKDYFKGISYDDIRPIFEKYFNSNVAFLEKSKEKLEEEESGALKRKTKSFEEKATKKQKYDEEVQELKKHLQIVPNDD